MLTLTNGVRMIASEPFMSHPEILCIIGPTASGKSARAVARALECNGEVISVDSRQVYRTLDIGTEKITPEEMQGVPHHLIDIRDPEDPYSAGMFVKDATRLIHEIRERGRFPILAGGTHFYFDALLNGLPSSTGKERYVVPSSVSNEVLYEQIRIKDPRRAAELDPNNRRRLIRALELIELYGSVPRRPLHKNTDIPFKVKWEVVTLPKEELKKKIVSRLETALSRGLLEEVRRTYTHVGIERLNELGLEYRIIGEHIQGKRDADTLLHALSAKLFQYARRQEAWVRKLLPNYNHIVNY